MTAENRSEWASVATGVSAPVLLWCTGASWLWVLAGGLAAACVCIMVRHRQPDGQTMADKTCGLFGKYIGKGVLALQAAGLAVGAGFLLRRCGGVVPNLNDGFGWIAPVLAVLALAAVWSGRRSALVCGAVLFWLPAITVMGVLLFCLPQIRVEWLLPVGPAAQIMPACATFLLPVVMCYCRRPNRGRVQTVLTFVLVGFGVLASFLTSACISPLLAAEEQLPFLTLTASCQLLGHASRFDALISMTIVAAVFGFLCCCLCFVQEIFPGCSKQAMVLFALLVLAAATVMPMIPVFLAAAFVVLCWGGIPVVVACGKNRKNLRKS